ncbi:sarcoplasmic reticulum histidine-rich calcium-binding protein [Thalassophryne amazonica]|uniref:sarcoplasmic reticulum histidine-rich calcium-binding protein n=1 Tax=Thalassophryne amazonica TaxID=390379 RepID=UPI001470A535|nr:sarcoplasmic reticulum histidine-rich calcium-binding protein [Thalassophryne amazonica]
MLDARIRTVLLFGCAVFLIVTSAVNANGRVFVVDLRNSSGLQGYKDAEQGCASQHARLASAQELHHAAVDCFFSSCTRGWLYGGTIGTTVCNVVGGELKVVDVRTENATEDSEHLHAFCVKDKGAPCGNPPSFPNTRLQGHTGFEFGDELLYACAPGHVMLSGQNAFSLLCDSCGEWYGLVHICVKDDTQRHMDYEDKFIDSFRETQHNNKDDSPEVAHGKLYEEMPGRVNSEAKRIQEQQEASLTARVEGVHKVHQEAKEVERLRIYLNEEEGEQDRKMKGREQDEDITDHSKWEQERMDLVRTDAAVVTDSPDSLISQKHIFWLPSETFQEEGHPVSTNPVTQRGSGSQSRESKEHDSQDPERDSYETLDQDDHDDSRHDDRDSHHDNQDDRDSYDNHQDDDNHDDNVRHYVPVQHGDLDRRGQHEHHDDHYDMGEHEDGRDHVWYTSQGEYDEKSYEDDDHTTNDGGDDDQEHPDGFEKPQDRYEHDDTVEDYLIGDNDHYTDHDHYKHDDHNHDRFDNHDDHDSHEDGLYHVIFSMAANEHHNGSHKGARGKEATPTDDSWLDGYAIVPDDREKGGSMVEGVKGDEAKKKTVISTERPKGVLRPIPYTSRTKLPEFSTPKSELEQWALEEVWPGFIPTAAPSSDSSDPDPLDTMDYDTQQVAPTHSWLVDLTEHPFFNQGPAPPVQTNNIITGIGSVEEHNEHHSTAERDQKDNVVGEKGEAICTGENCPPRPPSSSRQGSMAAIIIVVVSVVATAVIVGVWYYQRQQRKSSMYEMNGKDQGQNRHAQQIEMHQKV